ncbi:MAG: tripartite tricarboxylate transporter substrate binding protein [Hyphomicrobiales bacterium]|nr:MAG: tripartite tricarboxylate transporter substrate binding protein [Hyphomicrobiales bacterium]
MRTLVSLAAASLLALATSSAALAEFPEKPITIVVSAQPGGSPDILARIIGQHLSARIGQPVVVENRSGGAGAVANQHVASQPADGYTLLGTSDTLGINVTFFPDQGDPREKFTPVIQAMSSPQVLAVRADLPIADLAQYIEAAKAEAEIVSVAVPGVTTAGNLLALVLEAQAAIDLNIAVYPSAQPSLDDVLGGHVDSVFVTLGPALPHIQAGKLRAIAVTTPERTPSLPDVPTFRELGLDGVTSTSWQGYFAPAGTPPEVIAKLNAEINAVLQDPAAREQLLSNAFDPAGGTPEELGKLFDAGVTFWNKIITDNNVQIQN